MGLGLASVRFGVASGLVCSAALVFQFDVFAKLHIYLIVRTTRCSCDPKRVQIFIF